MSSEGLAARAAGAQRGATLIEAILFIVIVGVAVGTVLAVFVGTSRQSGEPMIRKQALAIAESLLEEVRLMPFTFCDPDDANLVTATGAFIGPTGCATTLEGPGTEGGEARGAVLTPLDNVSDYAGLVLATASDITGTAYPGYSATIVLAALALGAGPNAVPAGESWLITVNVTGPAGIAVQIEGIRTRHAPNL